MILLSKEALILDKLKIRELTEEICSAENNPWIAFLVAQSVQQPVN